MIVFPSEPTTLIKDNSIKVIHDQIQPYVTKKKSSKRSRNA